jgi:hypothetical protein
MRVDVTAIIPRLIKRDRDGLLPALHLSRDTFLSWHHILSVAFYG